MSEKITQNNVISHIYKLVGDALDEEELGCASILGYEYPDGESNEHSKSTYVAYHIHFDGHTVEKYCNGFVESVRTNSLLTVHVDTAIYTHTHFQTTTIPVVVQRVFSRMLNAGFKFKYAETEDFYIHSYTRKVLHFIAIVPYEQVREEEGDGDA